MSTYDHKQVLTDYARGHMTPEMAVGHSLQHIDKLYEAQTAARNEWRAEIDALRKQLHLVQMSVDRLNGIIEKARAKQKSHTPANPSKPGQA
ncbi:MAG: hypothetical protein ACOYNY_07125 [Caldilineaceae bacterium]|jgi:hypothetical protein